MTYDRGSVVLVLFPDSSFKTAKRRPALVVQRNRLGTRLPQTLIAMISSNMLRAGHPSRVTVLKSDPANSGTGLRSDSIVMPDNLATVLDTEIDRAIGSFGDMGAVDAALRHTLGL